MKSNTPTDKKRLIIFIVLAVVIAWSVFMLIPLLGLTYGQGSSVIILAAAMFAPALSSILTRLITKEGFKNMYLRPNFKGHIKTYLLVYFGPTLLLFLSMALYFMIFPKNFDSGFTVFQKAVGARGTGGMSAATILALQVLVVVFAGPIINIIPTMGEELGWRGYLLPKLRGFLSDRSALVVTGVIWGLWHAPVIAMGHNYGTDYWGFPWLGILAMTVFCVVLGIIEGYVSIKLKSAIPAAMIHSLVNAGAGLPLYLIKGKYNVMLGPAITGLIGILPFAVLAVILMVKAGGLRESKASNEQPTTSEPL